MKIGLFSVFLTLILASNLLLSNTFAQDYTQWELPEGAIARLGKGGIRKIQYSPDNRFLAVASTIGIWIYDAVTLQEALLFAGNVDGISCVSLSPDGRTFAVGSGRGSPTLGYHYRRASGNAYWTYEWDIRRSVQFRWTDYRNWQQ